MGRRQCDGIVGPTRQAGSYLAPGRSLGYVRSLEPDATQTLIARKDTERLWLILQ